MSRVHVFEDGTVEDECRKCGEPLLISPGDKMHIVMEEDEGNTYFICARCFDPDERKRPGGDLHLSGCTQGDPRDPPLGPEDVFNPEEVWPDEDDSADYWKEEA